MTVRTTRFLALAALALAALPRSAAQAEPSRPYLDLPITQTIGRDGIIRYSVWITVGDRSVEALLDTGSTGLRVLRNVVTADLAGGWTGPPTATTLGTGVRMEGVAIKAPVAIGSLAGTVPVQVVGRIDCARAKPDCEAAKLDANSYLIGGGGYPSEGFSAILGIGLPFHGTDIDNPLQALGATRWIVDLPRPYAAAPGHLILTPATAVTASFTLLDRDGTADAAGCIEGGPLAEPRCGTVLFDTGTSAMSVAADDIETTTAWPNGASGALSFSAGDRIVKLPLQAGADDGPQGVSLTPQDPHDEPGTFICAGVTPFFAYDVLYDAGTHTVGVRKRPAQQQRRDDAESAVSIAAAFQTRREP